MKLTLNTKTTFVITKFITVIIALFFFLPKAQSQGKITDMGYTDYDIDAYRAFKISSGNNVVKIGTIISSYLDLRSYPVGQTADNSKNTIKSKDARIDIKGNIGDDINYHLQLDFGAWDATYQPDGGPLDDANFTFKGFKKLFNINLGYGKVPFSLNSLVEHYESPYWERPEVSKGDFMSRRDLGLRLTRTWWDDRIRAEAGVYTGVGEVVLGGTNDASGAFEYIGRVEASYPEDHNEEIIDTKGLTTPNISIGLNARYSKRDLPAAADTFLTNETGALLSTKTGDEEDYKVLNGEKYILGGDVSILYRGFSLQFETDVLKGTPQQYSQQQTLYAPDYQLGLLNGENTKYFRAGGWYVAGNYFSKPIKTIFSVRYDEMDVDDLLPGDATHWAAGVSYQVKGYNSMIKFEFDQNLQQQSDLKYGAQSINTNKWHDEYRIGWQLVID